MLEWIREFLMTRIQQLRDKAERFWEGKKLCPKIKKIDEKIVRKAADCIPVKSDNWHYEIQCFHGARYTVNLKNHSCSCADWDLIGLPYKHGMNGIFARVLDLEDFVHYCYHVDTFYKVYQPAVMRINGQLTGEKARYIPPLPLNFGRKKGRHVRARRLKLDEVRKSKKATSKENEI